MMGTDGAVALVIPTWNGSTLLATCLDAVTRLTVRPEIVIVDNGSTDGTVDWLRTVHPSFHVIQNPCNLGFAAAVNQGIRATRAPWVALLNNDAVPDANWLERLLEAGTGNSRIGAVASRMMFSQAPHLVNSAGIRIDRSAAPWDFLLGQAEWPIDIVEVFGASAGACLYRRDMLEDIGLFDEEFFAYLEDVDLAWRARARGWLAVLAPQAVVYHGHSATAGEGSSLKRYYLARNKWRVIVRNYPAQILLTDLPLILFYDSLSLVNSLLAREMAPLRGRLAFLRQLPDLLRQRGRIQAQRTASQTCLRSALSSLEFPHLPYLRARLVSQLAARSTESRKTPRTVPVKWWGKPA